MCLCLFTALVTFIFVIWVKLSHFKILFKTLCNGSFITKRQSWERFISFWFVTTTLTANYRARYSWKEFVDKRWIRLKILLVYLAHRPVLVFIVNLPIEFNLLYRSLFVLELAEYVNKEFMTVMLHRRVKSFPNQVLQTSGV